VDGPFEGTLNGYSSPGPTKFCSGKQQQMLKDLKRIAPKAAILTCVSLNFGDSDKDSEEEAATETALESEENTIPELMTSFFDTYSINYSETKLHDSCKKVNIYITILLTLQCPYSIKTKRT